MTINSCGGGRGGVVSGMVRPSSSVPGVMSEAEHAAKMMKVTNVIVAVTDRLLCHFCTGFRSDQFEFSDLCYRLARYSSTHFFCLRHRSVVRVLCCFLGFVHRLVFFFVVLFECVWFRLYFFLPGNG